jgi:iron complex outermembrane receptor protein
MITAPPRLGAALALAALLSPAGARAQHAQDDDQRPQYETTVTALRLPRPLPDVPSAVWVVPREELERVPGLGMDELVRLVPVATTFRRTPSLLADPTAQGLSLRAVGPSGVSRALVLVDGVPANDPFGGWVYWRALPRLGLDRIEVVPGGSSALYGNYGLGGVVQLVSRPPEDAIEADVAGGNLGTAAVAARAAGRHGPLAGSLELDGLRSDGYVPVAPDQRGPIDAAGASKHLGGNARGRIAVNDDLQLGARAGVFGEEQNGGTHFTTASVRTASYALDATTRTGARDGGGRLVLALSGSAERFRQRRARIAAGRASEELAARQRVLSHAEGASAVWSSGALALAGRHHLVVGGDLRRVTGASTEELSPPAVTAATVVRRRAGGQQRFAGLFLEELYAPSAFVELSAAARVDHWQDDAGGRTLSRATGDTVTAFAPRSGTELSPRLGVLVRPTEWTRVRASGYRAFRLPTLNELYRPFQVGTVLTAANEELTAERLLGAELGVELLVPPASSLRVTGFLNRLADPIANVTLAEPAAAMLAAGRQRQNLGRVDVRGLDVAADARLPWRLVASAGYSYAATVVKRAPAQPELVGLDVAHAPRHRARLALGIEHRRVQGTLQLRLLSRAFEDDLNTLPMAGYAVIDAQLGAPITRRLGAFASVQNLLDERYLVGRAGVDTIGPPLQALVGVRVR